MINANKLQKSPLFKMKQIVFLCIFSLSFLVLKGQYVDDSYNWYPRQIGVKGGINSTSLNYERNQQFKQTASSDSKFGYLFNVGYWIPITTTFRPRIEISFDVLNSDVSYTNNLKNGGTYAFNGNTRISYGSVAFLPELVFGKKVQFSLFAGFQFSALIQAHEIGETTTIDSSNTIVTVLKVDKKDNTIAESIDSGLLTGLGVRYRFSKKIHISAEGRFRFGTTMIYGIYKPFHWGVTTGLIYQL